MKKKIIFIFLLLFAILTVAYFAGPRPAAPVYSVELPLVPTSLHALEKLIIQQEKSFAVKTGNEAKIVWESDSQKAVTPYVIIYLHGFGASSEEGNPVHRMIAKKFGCNLLLTRLSDHGLVSDQPMKELTVDRMWNSSVYYYAVAKKLGRKVILMGTSTGGTLALKMAAEFPEIAGVILFSPNVEVNNSFAWVLNNPWGLQIARKTLGGEELMVKNAPAFYKNFWYDHYRLEAVTEMQEMVETTMTSDVFERIKQPLLLLYYYKDEKNQDKVVKVDAMLKMFDQVGTAENKKMKHAVPEAENHVIACSLRSKGIARVEQYTEEFMKNVLGINVSGTE